MERSTHLAGIAAAVLLATAPANPGTADFHPACANDFNGADASVALAFDEVAQTLVFSGTVTCDGADLVFISAQLVRPGNGDPATATASCTNCTVAETASGTVPAAPGVYVVRMSFDARDATGGEFTDVRRDAVYAWPGVGQPAGTSCTVVINACMFLPAES